MTDIRADYNIPSWSRERTSRLFDTCANCGGRIVPGMSYERRLFRHGTGEPNSSGEFEGALSWDKVHVDCSLPWWQLEHNPIANPLVRLRCSASYLASHSAVAGGDICITTKGNEVLWVPKGPLQEALRTNPPKDVQRAVSSIEAMLELLLLKIEKSSTSKQAAARLSHVITDLADV